jgi:similar to stage IV sporulation protein
MMLYRLMGLILGSNRVRVKGCFPEKFINLATAHGIRLWNIRIYADGLRFETDTFSYKRLWGIHHATGCQMVSEGRRGLWEVLRTLKRRKVLLAGFFCFWLVLWYMGGMIWSVQIEGLENLQIGPVREHLEEQGVRLHARYGRLDFREIEQEMYIEFPEIAWVAIDRRGTYVKIRIVEKEPDPIQGDTPIDIIAAYDGIITDILVLQGIPLVETGMTVIKGERLISGFKTEHGLVNAAGTVRGFSWFEGYGECGLEEVTYRPTGHQVQVSYLWLGGRLVRLRGSGPNFKHYDISIEKKPSRLFPGLSIVTRVYRETEQIVTYHTPEEALEIATERAMRMAHQQVPENSDILTSEINRIPLREEIIRMRVRIEVKLELGTENIDKGD